METVEQFYSSYRPNYKNEEEKKDTEKNAKCDKETKTKTNTGAETETSVLQNVAEVNKTFSGNQNIILDPMSVIIKLAIIKNKPIGTKLFIKDNVVHIQEPGFFQGLSRYINKTNRNDLQYLYNPIQIACKTFLHTNYRRKNQKIIDLFVCAQKGILQLNETYKGNSIINLCLNYYYIVIDNYIKETSTSVFRDDELTALYTDSLIVKLNDSWTSEKIKIVLDIICFLNDDVMASDNVKSLETFIQNVDKSIHNKF